MRDKLEVKRIYIVEGKNINRKKDTYFTGIMYETTCGKIFKQYSTDVIQTLREEIKNEKR